MTTVSAAVDDNAISARLRNLPKDKRQQARQSILQAIDPSLEKHEAFERIARLHWWAASAAPD
ncbi:hypothetical protein [Xanthomonas campestris]|uniref:hypothetical protein n=1 Tax=Xanthomonas campestris TaxID=339 RepID=UPI001F3BFE6E|nr:hypothetical protein [Xanthomonas campestris]